MPPRLYDAYKLERIIFVICDAFDTVPYKANLTRQL